MEYRIGQIGHGFVGKALHDSFAKRSCNTIIYDKYQEIGSIKDLLDCHIIFMCLPTPYVEGHGFDLNALISNLRELKKEMYSGTIVIKSTVEPGVTEKLAKQFQMHIIHNPEFLTARTAFEDFDNQDHIVLGTSSYCKTVGNVERLYQELYPDAKISVCTSTESESMKMFVNNFYAMKIQIFNEFYFLCQKIGADFEIVKNLMLENGWINPMHTQIPGHDGEPSYGGACVVPETILIEKNKGEIAANDISIGDMIFDGNNFTKVTKIGKRFVDTSIKIKSRGRELRASIDHIHMIYENNKLQEKLFKNIELKDKIFLPKIKIPNVSKINIGPKPKIKGLCNWIEKVEINKDISRLFGLYASEGYSNIYKYKRSPNSSLFKKDYTVCWTFGPNEEYLADEVISILEKYGLKAKKKFKISKNATFGESKTWQVRKRSLWLYTLIKSAKLGDNAHNKGTLLFSNDNAKAFISGWLDGDGYFDKSNNSISGFSRSKKLILSIDKMLLSLGIQSSITKDGQQINISKRADVLEVLSWCKNIRFKVIPKYKTNFKWSSTNSEIYKNGWLSNISNIEKIDERIEVISIETESNLYVANSILTHNCFPKDTNALNHLMKTVGSPHEVLEACISERNKMRKKKWE